jgi:vacuolar-type H+-ATPase subunit C/Vma6
VSVLAPSADFVYGNTRLRARKSALLGPREYELLLGRDVDGILETLTGTAYRPETEAALAVFGGRRALHEALRRNLARVLEEERAFYDGRARRLVDLLLSRFDLHNLLALLRGLVRGRPADEILVNVFPLGPLGDAAAHEIARQEEVARAVGLLVGWRLPDPATARALAQAWPEYERTEDLRALEHTVTVRHAVQLQAELDSADAEPLRELVAREHDAVNLLIVLRLRFALQLDELSELPPVPAAGRYLPGGRMTIEALDTALRQPTRAEAVAKLVEAARREDWRVPLERISGGGDLPTLQRELEKQRVRWAVGLFHRGDPLGVDIPIAYTIAKENEVRNLRLLGEAAAGALPAPTLRAELTVPFGGGRWDG